MTVRKPEPLRPGGKIGVVAPAGCVEEVQLARGIEAIRQEGFAVEIAPNAGRRKGYLAGDERLRAEDLDEFFRRPDIGAIFCARGGFGSIQLLPHLRAERWTKPKIFAGYSDITILLNWLLQECGMVTFHAPMVAMDLARGLSDQSKSHFWGMLTGKMAQWQVGLGEAIRPGKARARLMGGCLSMLVTTLGTPYEIDASGRLLFIEDVGEKPYRVERMLTHLKMAGKFKNVAGIVFGHFTGCDGDPGRDVRQVIGELFEGASYPVATGLAAGHGEENLALPFGVKMELDADRLTLSMLESPVA
ncbi:MAG TPA: LD-carboxypeptidase [Candidatus Eisenbacteria bacterium]|nr:LD-carboxypeptidase [Candidatus Eisenbacteria bacterium]